MESIKKFLKYFIQYFFISLLVLLMMFFLFYYIANYIYNNKHNFNYISIYNISSRSMEPTLKINDLVLVYKPNEEKINIGDIISFNNDYSDYTVTHRIIKKEKDDKGYYYITQGDNVYDVDNLVLRYDDIDGKVFLIIPMLGHLTTFTKTKLGWSVLVLIPCLIILIIELIKLIKAFKIKNKMDDINNSDDVLKNKLSTIDKNIEIVSEKVHKNSL